MFYNILEGFANRSDKKFPSNMLERPSNIFEHVQKHQTCFIGFLYNKLMCLSNRLFKFLILNILYVLYDISGQLPGTIVILKMTLTLTPSYTHKHTHTITHCIYRQNWSERLSNVSVETYLKLTFQTTYLYLNLHFVSQRMLS